MENNCTGYWYECDCEDCKLVTELYEDLEWYRDNDPDNITKINTLIESIENMGYFV